MVAPGALTTPSDRNVLVLAGMNDGAPQSVYQLDTTGMTKLSASPHLLTPGQT